MKNKYVVIISLMLVGVILLELIFPSQRIESAQNYNPAENFSKDFFQYTKYDSLQTEFEKNDYVAMNYDNPVGVWISYIELSQMLRDCDEDSFRNNISDAFDKITSLGANTVYVHVRAFSDAYYPTAFYQFTSSFGSSEPFDALEIMIEEAHVRKLSFHAWINPLRCLSEKNIKEVPDVYPVKKLYNESFGEKLVAVDSSPYLWLNPAYEDVRALVSNGAAEIVSRYDVDAIHIDDYFYPTISDEFDELAFKASGKSDLSDWRMLNINHLVVLLNANVKSVNPTVLFEISPQGNINNNYTQMYADVEKWCSSGKLFCDVIIPQVYFGYNSSSPYLDTIYDWNDMVSGNDNIKLVIGLGVYKIAEESEFRDTKDIISKQITDAMSLDNTDGVSLYGYSVLFDDNELSDKMNSEREAIKLVIK